MSQSKTAITVGILGLIGAIAAAFIQISPNLIGIQRGEDNPSINNSRNNNDSSKKKSEQELKNEMKETVIEYLDVFEEALERNNLSILGTIAIDYTYEYLKNSIERNIEQGWYVKVSHRDIDIIDFNVDSDESIANVNVATLYEGGTYESNGSCISYTPQTDIRLKMTLKKINGDWKVSKYNTNAPTRQDRC